MNLLLLTAGHLKRETGRDTLLSKVFTHVQSGWPKMVEDIKLGALQLLKAFVMLETELWLEITGMVILGGKQPQLGSKSCKVEIDGAEVWKRQADQMTTTGVGNGIEDEPGSMAVEPEWRLDRQGDSADQSYP
ncbi:hypothetical protein EMCRGX_G011526 [Ephydatia muelleri]